MIDTNKINPDGNVFCVAPWLSLNINQNGDIQPCCQSLTTLGNVLKEDIKDIWNNDKMKEVRRCMVEKIPLESCKACYEKEVVGQKSLRQVFNENLFSHGSKYIYETNDDYSVNEVGFIHWDVKFGNKCNFKCRTCCPGSSSSIEFEEYGRITGENDFSKINFHRIKPYVDVVNHLYFSGGEPLIIEEHYKMIVMLMKLGKHNKKDFYLNYNTNFSTLTYKKHHIFDIWDKFQNVFVSISVEGVGDRGELIRNGFKWDRFVSNVEKFNERFKDKKETHELKFDCTVQAMNVFDVVNLHQTLFNTGLMENIDNFHLNYLHGPRELAVWLLDIETKEKAKHNIRNHIDNFLIPNNSVESIREFESLIKYIDLYQDQHLIPEFVQKMSSLDRKRNENTFKTFPELSGVWSTYLDKKNPLSK
jgi:MoaA/NifB/PqqE/SkfB family radical SAM enzyme